MEAFADFVIRSRERSRRAGTLLRSDATNETALAIVRDLSVFLAGERGKRDWALTEVQGFDPRLVTDFAALLGIDVSELAALTGVLLREVPRSPGPETVDAAALLWEVRRLSATQARHVSEPARAPYVRTPATGTSSTVLDRCEWVVWWQGLVVVGDRVRVRRWRQQLGRAHPYEYKLFADRHYAYSYRLRR
ncbi:hypothetical protein ABZ934_30540 [Streptomyces sp. NPDC046557]|uniref:hypothetical protein n=1 Tax=Streptomyces sp. NPDC046557 TaxID=3155372 RepID=UPI0033ED9A17